MARKLKTGLGFLIAGLAAKASFFKILGFLVLQDYLTLQLGSAKGFTVTNLLIAVGVSLLFIHFFEKRGRS